MYPSILQILNTRDDSELHVYSNEMDLDQKCAVLVIEKGELEIADGTGPTFEAALAECEREASEWLAGQSEARRR